LRVTGVFAKVALDMDTTEPPLPQHRDLPSVAHEHATSVVSFMMHPLPPDRTEAIAVLRIF
jgi:hypothetical protein